MPNDFGATRASQAPRKSEATRPSPKSKGDSTGDGSRRIAQRVNDALLAARQSGMIADFASNHRAKSWMTRMAKGSDSDLRTNLFILSGKSENRIYESYERIKQDFDSIFAMSMKNVDPFLRELIQTELEDSNRDKMGPKSMFRGFYEDGPKKLEAVFSDKATPSGLDKRALGRARDRLVSEIPAQSIRLMSVDQTLAYERKGNILHDSEAPGLDSTTNSGPPFFLSRWKEHPSMDRERYEYTKQVYEWIRRRTKLQYEALSRGNEVDFTAMVAQRTVNRGPKPMDDEKTKRMVIAMEKSEAILWKMFTPQVQAVLKQYKLNGVRVHNAWCDTPIIDVEQQLILEAAFKNNELVVSGDISAFDTSVLPSIWVYMAEGMSSWFYRSPNFFKALNRSVVSRVRALAPDGIHGPGPSSIKSGSGGTNFIDCQYNKLALYYGEELGLYKLRHVEVQGDDFCAVGPGVNPESLSVAYGHLNLTMHPDKQTHVEGALSYLQRLHVKGKTGGIASAYRVLNSVLVQEKTKVHSSEWNPYMEAIQAISKLDNAAFNPAFENLVNYVASHDKYKLGADLPTREVIRQAGSEAGEVLSRGSDSFSTSIMTKDKQGFDLSPTNRVLRGKILADHHGRERFSDVYDSRRLSALGLL